MRNEAYGTAARQMFALHNIVGFVIGSSALAAELCSFISRELHGGHE